MAAIKLERVLVVDDSADFRFIAEVTLEIAAKVEVKGCSSGRQALAEAPGFAPDVILLDVNMPDMTGPQVLKAMRATPELATVPVIFLTGEESLGSLDEWASLHVVGVLTKPLDPATLRDELESMLAASDS